MKPLSQKLSNLFVSFVAVSLFILLITTDKLMAQEPNSILGTWLIQDKDAKVEIFEKAGIYYGKIAWMKFPKDENGNDKVDDKNPDPTLRSRKKQDLVIMSGFKYDASEKEWAGGTIYDSKSGKTYDGYIKIQEDGTLFMKGYILGMRFLGRSNIWTRADS